MPTSIAPRAALETAAEFLPRHIGISAADEAQMLSVVGAASRRALIDAIRLRDAREAPRLMLAHLARIESQLEFTPPAAEAPDLARLLGGV